MAGQTWTLDDLRRELSRFEAEVRAAGLAESSVQTYVDGTATFIRWLAGEYRPHGPRT